MNDYRNTQYCNTLENIKENKKELEKQILNKHPRVTNFYKQIKPNNNSSYKRKFIEIYNNKCSYCGVLSDIVSIENFEIDHFICKADTEDEINKNELSNLVLACKYCNRKKSNLIIEDKYKEQLHPDNKDITKFFYRDNLYNIKIEDTYKNNEFIKTFYDKLNFIHFSRKLDYLLLNLIKFKEQIEDDKNMTKIKNSLNEAIIVLSKKRNNIFFDD